MKTPRIENLKLKHAFGQMLPFAPAHVLILLLLFLGLPSRLVALDLDLVRVGSYDTSVEALGVAPLGNVNSTTATLPGTSWATASGIRNAINVPLP